MPAPLTPTAPVTGIGQSLYNTAQELARRKRAMISINDPSSPYSQAARTASLGVLALQDPSNPLYAASTGARRNLIAAQTGQNAQQRGYYTTAGQLIAARTGENQALATAMRDTPDFIAVAQAQGQRNAINRVRDQVGIQRPLEIDTLQSDTTPLPVGVARSLRPNADYIAKANAEADRARALTLEGLRNQLDITGTNVNDVRLAGDVADLNLNEARAGAGYRSKIADMSVADAGDQAKYQYSLGSLALEEARMAADSSGLVPYEDPRNPTGVPEYITQAEKDRRDYTYRQSQALERVPADEALSQTRQRYNMTADAGGSPLAALSQSTLLNTLPANTSIWDPQYHAVIAELVRRYRRLGYSEEAANIAAIQSVYQELASRKQNAAAPPSVIVNVP